MGTLIRTAEWFGICDIVCSPDCVEIWNPKVIQATMGSIFRANIVEADLTQFLPEQQRQGRAVYGALLEGENLFEMKDCKDGVIVIGSESHGIRKEVLPYLSHPITIPRVGASQTESLNASIAAAIIMAELTR
jgi:TrmH family RNA methyltransferase